MKKILMLILAFSIVTGSYSKTNPEDYMIKAKISYEKKDYKTTDKIIREALVEYPTEEGLLKIYAKNLTKLGKFKDSYVVLKGLILDDQENGDNDKELYQTQIFNIKSMQQKKIKVENVNLDDELKICQGVLASLENLNNSDEIFEKGNQLMKSKDYEKALEIFEMDKDEDIRNLLGAGIVNRILGFNSKSIEYLNKVIEKDPDNVKVYKELAMSYQGNKDYRKAIDNFNIYLSSIPEERTFVVVANIYIGAFKDYKSAKRTLLTGQDFFPNSKVIGELLKDKRLKSIE